MIKKKFGFKYYEVFYGSEREYIRKSKRLRFIIISMFSLISLYVISSISLKLRNIFYIDPIILLIFAFLPIMVDVFRERFCKKKQNSVKSQVNTKRDQLKNFLIQSLHDENLYNETCINKLIRKEEILLMSDSKKTNYLVSALHVSVIAAVVSLFINSENVSISIDWNIVNDLLTTSKLSYRISTYIVLFAMLYWAFYFLIKLLSGNISIVNEMVNLNNFTSKSDKIFLELLYEISLEMSQFPCKKSEKFSYRNRKKHNSN